MVGKGSSIQGRIDKPANGLIQGWIASVGETIEPMLFINGYPAEIHQRHVKREDVNKALGLPGELGFTFSGAGLREGDVLELYAFDGRALHFVYRRTATDGCPGVRAFDQIVRAKEISQDPNSVAVACWDSAHNPVGRAYVLYQALEQKRPVTLFAFLFSEFGGELWEPLQDTPFNRVLIPWEERQKYFHLFRIMKLEFPAIWMCKPRLPTFDLAANISNSKTKLILDHDDNDYHFSKQTKLDRVYGPNSVSLAQYLQSRMTANTAASITLSEEYDATLVRHARALPATPPPPRKKGEVTKIGFIGTVRPHKGMIEAARAIKLASWKLKKPVEFHVYGNFNPSSMKEKLEDLDVTIKENIPQSNLNKELENFDLILTGFPSGDGGQEEITKYQISSKIGDGLAVGRPVLVPYGESVADLKNLPGVFLFEQDDFSEVLGKAINYSKKVSLPHAFTLEGAYEAFAKEEEKATTPPLAFSVLKQDYAVTNENDVPTLLLIWKQHDSAMYGRRVDQIARGYKELNPGHRVVVLEFCHISTQESYQNQAFEFCGDAKMSAPLIDEKGGRKLIDQHGVEYHSVNFPSVAELNGRFLSYLVSENLSPTNTKAVIFPIVRFVEQIYDILSAYKCLVDVVDNQFSWAKGKTTFEYGKQYSSLLKMSSGVVFNSAENMSFFRESGFLEIIDADDKPCSVIENWYGGAVVGPDDVPQNVSEGFNLVYSGNMNDRIDWSLIDAVAAIADDITIHLAGGAKRGIEKLNSVTWRPNVVYWGPLSEEKVALLLAHANAGLLPHTKDTVSKFMNPLKVHMYRAHGVPVIATDVPGISEEHVTICKNRGEFLDEITALYNAYKTSGSHDPLARIPEKNVPEQLHKYQDLLAKLDD